MSSLLILLPLFGLIFLNIFVKVLPRRSVYGLAIAIFCAQIALAVFHNPVFFGEELRDLSSFFGVKFDVDSLDFIALFCIGIVSIASLLVARHTMYDDEERFKFTNLLMIASIGMSGMVLTDDLFTLYVFIEMASIASFILIAFNKDIYALEGAFKYILLSFVATVLILTGLALIFPAAPDLSFESLSLVFKNSMGGRLAVLGTALLVSGLLIKGGVMPFHGWLPDAYTAAPAAVSVLFGGIATKMVGIYALMRVVSSVFWFTAPLQASLLVTGAVSIAGGALAAMGQHDFKRMLAYSSISQVGYILLGLGTGSVLGITGAAFHLFNHAIFKSLLFVNSAAVETRTGTNNMNKMGGLAKVMPVTGTTSVIALLSAAGIPPTAGFWSKLMIILALWDSSHYAYAVIAVVTALATLAYLLSMQSKVFFGKLAEGMEDITEARSGIVLASIALAIIIMAAGILFPAVFPKFILPVKELIGV